MDCLRILSCFLIVLLHFSASYRDCVPIGSFSFNVMTVYNCFTRVGVPIFIMLSGYFLLGRDYTFEVKAYLKRPIRMIISFYIWSAFYAFQGIAVEFIRTGTASKERIDYTVHEFIFGHYHMWFCFLIIGYYILFPIAKKISEDFNVLRLFIVLWVVFSFFLQSIFAWTGMTVLPALIGKLEMNALVGYWGYFFLGYYLKKADLSVKKRSVVYLLGVISMGLTIYLSLYQSYATGEYVDTWFSTGSPFILMASAALFLLFTKVKVSGESRINTLIITVSEGTFFIYMLHIFILEKLNLIGITTISFNSLLAVPVLSLAAFVVSLLMACVVKRIPVLGRILLFK